MTHVNAKVNNYYQDAVSHSIHETHIFNFLYLHISQLCISVLMKVSSLLIDKNSVVSHLFDLILEMAACKMWNWNVCKINAVMAGYFESCRVSFELN